MRAMSQEDVNKSLESLHTEILNTPDETIKARLLSLIEDVEKQMQNPPGSQHQGEAVDNLPSLIEQFEVEHPQVTDTLSRLLTTLSGMGI
ncbi:MAG: DUF4404 family protein [Phormidesmis sp.]